MATAGTGERIVVEEPFRRFVESEVLPGLDITPDRFWSGFADVVARFAPRNRELLDERARLQDAIDDWYRSRRRQPFDVDAHRSFLFDIGYLRPTPEAVTVTTGVADEELSRLAAPQLVVPVDNARYALNAANARWGSLYDAVYGTDVLGDPPPAGPYDEARGRRVVQWARALLDEIVPLVGASHVDASAYRIREGRLIVTAADRDVGLEDPGAFFGYEGSVEDPSAVWCIHHDLGLRILIDRTHPVGAADPAGVRDIELEAAASVIMDAEDSVAAVDTADKIGVYRNLLGLMTGDLTAEVHEGGRSFTRRLAPPRSVNGPDGSPLTVRGTALMLVRNVGLLMTSPMVRTGRGEDVPEGIIDAVMTALIAQHDRNRPEALRNSRDGSVHVVKPKLHGPDEVAFTVDLFGAVEEILGLPPRTMKIGLMDEERRTTLNLTACIAEASDRIVFINTGFLDRTGDEIHTCMEAGPVRRKADMKSATWLQAYEDHNVDVGLAVGLPGHGQIGKGMWAAPDEMAAMLTEKVRHPESGATCAWVPSPTAATLHAIHYHRVDVRERQDALRPRRNRTLEELLIPPVVEHPRWSAEERRSELENNLQGILGYVSRWITQGVGCSKVPDIHGTALMEDRATCRISSQHVANWLHHQIVSEQEVEDTLRRMAQVVDDQNRNNPGYVPMMPDANGPAFSAARDLVLRGRAQPSGYTEPILHARRAEVIELGAQSSPPPPPP